ncbi:hypothetical protein GWC77_27620 [Paraburkholderia sp. NMBU_R16]|uniref:hypothetical protein n=1 Tax=Paraburkholderia sp. NMBU_R16 TaxID=2698676 RepID=UPI0015677FB8|nr:hypothetical protein [Paraburkholderia sp. NMBU_R16]NRO99626.1 hypothetical protein [Paraburkholderia sp. NMBU_R16]
MSVSINTFTPPTTTITIDPNQNSLGGLSSGNGDLLAQIASALQGSSNIGANMGSSGVNSAPQAYAQMASWMQQNGKNSMDYGDISQIAEGGLNATPEQQQAAKFLEANPQALQVADSANKKNVNDTDGKFSLNDWTTAMNNAGA